jgi:Beta-propeller repeat
MTFRSHAVAASAICIFSCAVQASSNTPTGPRMPFVFSENRGQAGPGVRFVGTGPEFKIWFEDGGVVLQQGQTTGRMSFENSFEDNVRPRVTAESPLGATANYLHGNDPHRWQTGIALFSVVRYTGLWQGVDLTYTAEQGRVKSEYLVAPGADPGRIGLRFDGDAGIQSDGTLRIRGLSGDFIEDKPVLYQVIGGERIGVAGAFEQRPGGAIGFRVGKYDRAQPLVIDPVILFSGYFGGSGEDQITAVAIDSLNNVLVAGWTASTDLPSSAGEQPRYGGGVDAFVASFRPNGGGLNYCTYLGGSGDDRAFGIAIDTARNVYLTGWTSSKNFPVLGAIQLHLNGTRDAFVTKLNAAGNSLVYSTYLGGTGVDVGYAIGVDSTNSAAIVGDSTSTNLPVSAKALQKTSGGAQDAFVAKLAPQGNSLQYLTYLGGSGVDHGSCIYVASAGGVYVGGYTWSVNFPTLVPFQAQSGGGQDGFFAKLNADGSALNWSSYLGGSGGSVGAPEEVNAIYRDVNQNLIIAGTTSSSNFPVTAGAFQTNFGGGTDGFVTRFNSSRQLLESTYIGGSLNDEITAMTVDFHGLAYLTGSTDSTDFPVQRPTQSGNAGALDAFVVKMSIDLSTLDFGTYLGGSGSDGGNAIAVDFETSMVVAGQTSSGNFPVAGSVQGYTQEVLTSFVTKIAPAFTAAVAYPTSGTQTITLDAWHVAASPQSTTYGNATDHPIVGDWDGSGKKRIGLFRNGTWILDINGNGVVDAADKTVTFGQAGDIPVVGDWLGTGHIALGLFRSGTFILDLSGHLSGVATGQSDATFAFGQGGDVPIVADWSGSGTTKVGIFRNGLWIVDYAGARAMNGTNRNYTYGQSGDLPVVGDWDSSGRPSKLGIYRGGLWVLDYDGDNVLTTPYLNEMAFGFGAAGYTPLIF